MCALNKTKKGTRHSATCFAHSYWLPYLPWCQAAWGPCQEWKFFFIKHALHVNW